MIWNQCTDSVSDNGQIHITIETSSSITAIWTENGPLTDWIWPDHTHTHTHTHTQQEHAPYSISHMPKLQTPLLLQTTTQHPLPETWPSWTAGTRRDLGLSPPWGESREGEEERVRAQPTASAPHCPPETAQLHSNPRGPVNSDMSG